MSLIGDLQDPATSPMVELFRLKNYNPSNPAQEYNFTYWRACTWIGIDWDHLDAKTSGFESNGRTMPKPKLQVPNIGGTIASIVRLYDDLIGATLYRYRTTEFYLQNDSAEMLLIDEFEIQQKINEDSETIDWELAAINIENKLCPGRIYQNSFCSWQYRGLGCGYTGPPVADINDQPTSDPLLDNCGRKIGSCELRYGAGNPLPIDIYLGLV